MQLTVIFKEINLCNDENDEMCIVQKLLAVGNRCTIYVRQKSKRRKSQRLFMTVGDRNL